MKPLNTTQFLTAVLVAAFVPACASLEDPEVTVSVTDSAGVRIVLSPAGMSPPESWALSPTPELLIGSVSGAPEETLFRVVGALRLPDGRVVVANRGSNEVRWFGPDGSFLFSRGGEGLGPGEYRGLRGLMYLDGDSVLATDNREFRATLYDSEGVLARSWEMEMLGPFTAPAPLGRLDDESLVARTYQVLGEAPGHQRFRQIVVRYDDGSLIDTVTAGPGGEQYSVTCSPAGRPAVCGYPVPFGHASLVAARNDRIVLGNGDGYFLRVFTPGGDLTAVYRRSVPRRAVTTSLLSAYVDSLVSLYPAERALEVRSVMSDAPAHDSVPSFVDVRMDDVGNLWLATPFLTEAGEKSWDVLDPTGALLAEVRTPSGFEVTSISDGHVTGVVRDPNDVEFVAVYALAKEKPADLRAS